MWNVLAGFEVVSLPILPIVLQRGETFSFLPALNTGIHIAVYRLRFRIEAVRNLKLAVNLRISVSYRTVVYSELVTYIIYFDSVK